MDFIVPWSYVLWNSTCQMKIMMKLLVKFLVPAPWSSPRNKVHQCALLVGISLSRYCAKPTTCQMSERRLALHLRWSSNVKRPPRRDRNDVERDKQSTGVWRCGCIIWGGGFPKEGVSEWNLWGCFRVYWKRGKNWVIVQRHGIAKSVWADGCGWVGISGKKLLEMKIDLSWGHFLEGILSLTEELEDLGMHLV